MPKSMKAWWKKWFCLRNDTSAPLPGSPTTAPFPSLTGGMRWLKRNSASFCPSVSSSSSYGGRGWRACTSCVTFFIHRIQPLRQRVTKTWLYPGPSCLDHSFFEELSEAEINIQIHKVLDHGANLTPGAGLASLRDGVAGTKVSPFGSVVATCTILSSHHARGHAQSLRGGRSAPWASI
jgi:hypothetical protein